MRKWEARGWRRRTKGIFYPYKVPLWSARALKPSRGFKVTRELFIIWWKITAWLTERVCGGPLKQLVCRYHVEPRCKSCESLVTLFTACSLAASPACKTNLGLLRHLSFHSQGFYRSWNYTILLPSDTTPIFQHWISADTDIRLLPMIHIFMNYWLVWSVIATCWVWVWTKEALEQNGQFCFFLFYQSVCI